MPPAGAEIENRSIRFREADPLSGDRLQPSAETFPGEHGLEIVKYIKDTYFLPVIVISGIYSDEELQNDIEELFIDCFLRKPIDSQTLYDNVEKILSENYRKELEDLINSTQSEIQRLRGLGVEKKDWSVSLGRSMKILSGEETGPMTEVIKR